MTEEKSASAGAQPVAAGNGAPASVPVDASFTLNATGSAPDNAPTIISRNLPAKGPAPQAWTDLVRGRRLAHFELEEAIGVGGMAAVVRARDLHLERPVALKILPPELAAEPDLLQRFEHEARAAARLDHENIARVYYCGHDKGLHFIAFEFVEGENLKTRIEHLGRIPVREAVHIVLQVASGLAHAATRGVVHRDIKPSNIILSENGRAKLVDMGLARSLDRRAEGGLTQSGVTLGTFDYISPEQAMEPRSADVRSDLYSLGCTLYHMVTGQSPVPEGTAARKLQFHQHEPPIDPRQLNPEVPDELAAIIARLMAKDAKDRYQRPEFLVQHLLAMANKLSGVGPMLAGEVLYVDAILPSPPRIRPAFLLATAALAVIVLIALLAPYLERDEGGAELARPASSGSPGKAGTPGLPGAIKAAVENRAPNALAPAAAVRSIKTVEELRELAGEDQDALVQLEDGVYDLPANDEEMGGLRFVNSRIVLEAKPGARPIIRYTPPRLGRTSPAIHVQGGKLVFHGVRFEFEAPGGDRAFQGFLLQGGQLAFRGCELRWSDAALKDAGMASRSLVKVVRPITPVGAATRLELRECVLPGGPRALDLDEIDQLVLERCAFGPFSQLVQVRGRDAGRGRIAITISECAFHLGPGPLLFAHTSRTVDVDCARSVFASTMPRESDPPPALVLLGRDQLERCRYRGQDNAFFDLSALVTRVTDEGSTEVLATKLAELPRLQAEFRDTGSQMLTESPWQDAEPLQRLAAEDWAAAFRLKASLAALRRPAPQYILGPRQLAGAELYANLEATASDTPGALKPVVKELVVDGVGGQPGTYRSLASALSDADFEEEVEVVITIKWNGPLPTRPLELGSRTIRIRAASGFSPELTFNPDSDPGADGEAALFRIRDGSLALEQLRFRLQPTLKETAKLQSLLAITGTGRCKLKGCLATLAGGDEPRMAVISIADPTGAMMGMGGKPPRAGVPAVELEDCVVRGQGECVTVRVSRPYRLDVKNALVVLNGTFLSVEGNKREASMSADGSTVSLERMTAYVSQHLVLLHATNSHPVHVPLRVSSATTCIFASSEESPLLRVDGPESELELKRRLVWQGRQNFYSTAASILVWQPLGMNDMMHKYDRERWGQLWGSDDDQARFARSIKFAGYPAGTKSPLAASPADFRIVTSDPFEPEPISRGADLDRLPQPPPPTPIGQP